MNKAVYIVNRKHKTLEAGDLDRRGKVESEDCRCVCGSLMAKITPTGIEIKCRKCKRIQVIPFAHVTREKRFEDLPESSIERRCS